MAGKVLKSSLNKKSQMISNYGCKRYYINNYWMRLIFCDIRNNQGRGKCYQPKPKAEVDNTNQGKCYQLKPKAEADNTNRDLDYSGYHKNRI